MDHPLATRPCIGHRLQEKRYLTSLGALACAATVLQFGAPSRDAAAQGCPLPESFTQSVSFDDAGLITTLACAKDTFAVGDSIVFRLSFENTGTTARTIGPNPWITPPDCIRLVLASCDSSTGAGCFESRLFWYPEGIFYFGFPVSLNPGQCRVVTQTWSGVPRSGGITQPGHYAAFGGFSNGTEIFYPQPGGVRLEVTIVSPVSAVPVNPASWGRIKERYR